MFSFLTGLLLLQATYLDLTAKGHTLVAQGNLKEAETVLKEAVSTHADRAGVVSSNKVLAEAYVKLNRLYDAIEIYKMMAIQAPSDLTILARLAELYAWSGDYDKAVVTYRDALSFDPRNTSLENGLARVLRWAHRFDEAERTYKDILSNDPENHEALKGLAKTYSMAGELGSALDGFEKALAIYPHDSELYVGKGTVLAWQKHYSRALKALDKAIELAPAHAEAFRTRGDVYSWMRSYRQAIGAYARAVEIEPANIENHLLLASSYRSVEDLAKAEESVKAALRLDPSDARAMQLLREIRSGNGYMAMKTVGEVLEGIAFAMVLGIIVYAGRTRKRTLKRKHRALFYFINMVVPFFIAAIFVWYLGKDYLSMWFNVSVLEEFVETLLFIGGGLAFLALLWSEQRNKELGKLTILAVGAHPDDIELGCGGFIMKAKDSGAKVYGLTMTKGENGTDRDGVREQEIKRASGFMELDGFWVLDFPDTALADHVVAMKNAIEDKIRETGATMVLAHTPIDIHTDHQAVFEAAKVGARKVSLLCYEDVSTPREFVPNYFIDIGQYISDKMKLISLHQTQEEKSYMDPEVIKGRAAHRGIQCGVEYAEAFSTYKLVR